MDWRLFIGAFLLFQVGLALRSVRWRFLLDAVQVPVPLHRLFYLYYVGTLFNTFLPSGFGGDAVKMYELARYSRRGSESIGTVFVDRLSGIVVLFILGLCAWPFAYRSLPRAEAVLLLLVSVGGLLATWALFRQRWAERVLSIIPAGKIREKFLSLYDAVHTCGMGALWKALAVSVVFDACLFFVNYVIALALNVHIKFLYFVIFMPILSLSMLLPSVGALGTREGAYVLLFGMAGVPEPIAIAMSLSFYLINVFTGAIGGILYMFDALWGLRKNAH